MERSHLHYAGVGARASPPDVLELMRAVAVICGRAGLILRSGAAAGADLAFEQGAQSVGAEKQIFLPWPGFNGSESKWDHPLPDAFDLAAQVHPAWPELSPEARKLQARDVHQILGPELKQVSAFVVCWTADGATCESECTSETGGTGCAIRLATRYRIPVINLARPDHRQRVEAAVQADAGAVLSEASGESTAAGLVGLLRCGVGV